MLDAPSQISPEERAAAREWLEHDRARHRLSGEPAHIAHEHAKELEERYPRARDIALAGTPEDLGELPLQMRRHQMRRRRASGIDARRAATMRQGFRHAPRQRRATRPVREPAVRSRGLLDRAGSAAGSLTGSAWGETITDILIWGAALSIGYLLITRVAAASKLAAGATSAVHALVSPQVDPLNPKGASAIAQEQLAAALGVAPALSPPSAPARAPRVVGQIGNFFPANSNAGAGSLAQQLAGRGVGVSVPQWEAAALGNLTNPLNRGGLF